MIFLKSRFRWDISICSLKGNQNYLTIRNGNIYTRPWKLTAGMQLSSQRASKGSDLSPSEIVKTRGVDGGKWQPPSLDPFPRTSSLHCMKKHVMMARSIICTMEIITPLQWGPLKPKQGRSIFHFWNILPLRPVFAKKTWNKHTMRAQRCKFGVSSFPNSHTDQPQCIKQLLNTCGEVMQQQCPRSCLTQARIQPRGRFLLKALLGRRS